MSHCQACPFMGCHDCAYRGGVDPNAPAAKQDSGATRRDNRTDVRDNGRGNDERPTALTADRSEPPRFALPNQECLPTW